MSRPRGKRPKIAPLPRNVSAVSDVPTQFRRECSARARKTPREDAWTPSPEKYWKRRQWRAQIEGASEIAVAFGGVESFAAG